MHLKQLVDDAEQQVQAARASTAAAQSETVVVQRELTTSQTQLAAAVKAGTAWRRRARELMLAVAAFGGAASLRFLVLVPLPWRYVAALAIAAAIYAALYAFL